MSGVVETGGGHLRECAQDTTSANFHTRQDLCCSFDECVAAAKAHALASCSMMPGSRQSY
eukprot:scaffold34189_cov16-Prasinocladus_malaysianus.AAC.1